MQTSLSTYDPSTLYSTLQHNLLDLIKWTFKWTLKNYGSLYLACSDSKVFALPLTKVDIHFGQNVCDALSYLLDNTSMYFDDLLDIGNPYSEGIVNQIYPSEKPTPQIPMPAFWIYIFLSQMDLFRL